MPLDSRFYSAAQSLFHPGMGTENVGPLLHAIACMRRPECIIAVGLGYSTLFLLQALADIDLERRRDAAVLAGRVSDPARLEVLIPEAALVSSSASPRLVAIDDFSDDDGRLQQLTRCAEELGLAHLLELHKLRYQDWSPSVGLQADLVWLDCGHQLDYAPLCNRFWPLVNDEGGLMAMHYTFVDVRPEPGDPPVMIAGPWLNSVKREHALSGIDAGFEMLSLVEPHKHRQGSVTLMRKSPNDRCRNNPLQQEQRALYGDAGAELAELNDFRTEGA